MGIYWFRLLGKANQMVILNRNDYGVFESGLKQKENRGHDAE